MLQSLLAASVLIGSPPAAQEMVAPLPRPPVLTHPTWSRPPALRAPSGRTHSRLVEIECGLQSDGSLAACQITEIIPHDDEAGDVALRALRQAKLDPTSLRDLPPDIRVRFPLQIWLGL